MSGLLHLTDPRSRNPFDRDERRVALNDLVDSLIGTSYAETTAALTVMRALAPDAAVPQPGGGRRPYRLSVQGLAGARHCDPRRLHGSMDLGAADLLTAERRREIIVRRDHWMNQSKSTE